MKSRLSSPSAREKISAPKGYWDHSQNSSPGRSSSAERKNQASSPKISVSFSGFSGILTTENKMKNPPGAAQPQRTSGKTSMKKAPSTSSSSTPSSATSSSSKLIVGDGEPASSSSLSSNALHLSLVPISSSTMAFATALPHLSINQGNTRIRNELWINPVTGRVEAYQTSAGYANVLSKWDDHLARSCNLITPKTQDPASSPEESEHLIAQEETFDAVFRDDYSSDEEGEDARRENGSDGSASQDLGGSEDVDNLDGQGAWISEVNEAGEEKRLHLLQPENIIRPASTASGTKTIASSSTDLVVASPPGDSTTTTTTTVSTTKNHHHFAPKDTKYESDDEEDKQYPYLWFRRQGKWTPDADAELVSGVQWQASTEAREMDLLFERLPQEKRRTHLGNVGQRGAAGGAGGHGQSEFHRIFRFCDENPDLVNSLDWRAVAAYVTCTVNAKKVRSYCNSTNRMRHEERRKLGLIRKLTTKKGFGFEGNGVNGEGVVEEEDPAEAEWWENGDFFLDELEDHGQEGEPSSSSSSSSAKNNSSSRRNNLSQAQQAKLLALPDAVDADEITAEIFTSLLEGSAQSAIPHIHLVRKRKLAKKKAGADSISTKQNLPFHQGNNKSPSSSNRNKQWSSEDDLLADDDRATFGEHEEFDDIEEVVLGDGGDDEADKDNITAEKQQGHDEQELISQDTSTTSTSSSGLKNKIRLVVYSARDCLQRFGYLREERNSLIWEKTKKTANFFTSGLMERPWSKAEEKALLALLSVYGERGNWVEITKKLTDLEPQIIEEEKREEAKEKEGNSSIKSKKKNMVVGLGGKNKNTGGAGAKGSTSAGGENGDEYGEADKEADTCTSTSTGANMARRPRSVWGVFTHYLRALDNSTRMLGFDSKEWSEEDKGRILSFVRANWSQPRFPWQVFQYNHMPKRPLMSFGLVMRKMVGYQNPEWSRPELERLEIIRRVMRLPSHSKKWLVAAENTTQEGVLGGAQAEQTTTTDLQVEGTFSSNDAGKDTDLRSLITPSEKELLSQRLFIDSCVPDFFPERIVLMLKRQLERQEQAQKVPFKWTAEKDAALKECIEFYRPGMWQEISERMSSKYGYKVPPLRIHTRFMRQNYDGMADFYDSLLAKSYACFPHRPAGYGRSFKQELFMEQKTNLTVGEVLDEENNMQKAAFSTLEDVDVGGDHVASRGTSSAAAASPATSSSSTSANGSNVLTEKYGGTTTGGVLLAAGADQEPTKSNTRDSSGPAKKKRRVVDKTFSNVIDNVFLDAGEGKNMPSTGVTGGGIGVLLEGGKGLRGGRRGRGNRRKNNKKKEENLIADDMEVDDLPLEDAPVDGREDAHLEFADYEDDDDGLPEYKRSGPAGGGGLQAASKNGKANLNIANGSNKRLHKQDPSSAAIPHDHQADDATSANHDKKSSEISFLHSAATLEELAATATSATELRHRLLTTKVVKGNTKLDQILKRGIVRRAIEKTERVAKLQGRQTRAEKEMERNMLHDLRQLAASRSEVDAA
ncbi:unnamed protein product [Amoebophrya sp. A25]|nr:unnamed protein product [Amoebophrya sp. A25]|eukprot:GSA25T00014793001.1